MRVEFNNIVKRYGSKTALSVPSWKMEPGEIVGLVGSNGAGKTTFLRLLLDLLGADEGTALINGKSVGNTDFWKRSTGSYLDASFLIDFLTIAEYLRFVGSVYGLENGSVERASERYADILPEGYDDSTRLIRELSTGNAKKVGIVAAMLHRPSLLILDEPFANLDPPSQIRLKKHLQHLARECGTTMLVSSHDLDHVTEICSRVTLVDEGEIVRDDKTSDETLAELKDYFAS